MANYLLYGNKMIEDDSTLEKFAQCVIDGVPEDDLEDIKQRYNVVDDDTEYEDEYMQRVGDILYDDISRTDIDYSELMERFAPELGSEILNWSDKSGIDTWSKEFKQANGSLSEAVSPIDENILLQLYKNANNEK